MGYNIRTKSGDVMSNLLQVNSLSYSYENKKVLDDISFSMKEGEFVSIIGPSSCGKTTLLKLIAGILPNHNSILFSYGYLNKKNTRDIKKIGCVFKDSFPFLFDAVYQELTFPLENLCYGASTIETRVLELTKLFDVAYLLDKRIEDLHQEEKAILLILIALIHNPVLLVLDNPFFNMRKGVRNRIIHVLKEYCKKNKIAILLATSNIEDILFCDKTYVLSDGTFVIEGDVMSVLEEDTNLKKLGLELPFMVSLSHMLIFYEILDDVYLDKNKLVNKLWK